MWHERIHVTGGALPAPDQKWSDLFSAPPPSVIAKYCAWWLMSMFHCHVWVPKGSKGISDMTAAWGRNWTPQLVTTLLIIGLFMAENRGTSSNPLAYHHFWRYCTLHDGHIAHRFGGRVIDLRSCSCLRSSRDCCTPCQFGVCKCVYILMIVMAAEWFWNQKG